MSERDAARNDGHEPGRYEIRLQGHLDPRWAAWFDGLRLSHERDGTTLLRGPVVDQAALHGLLRRVRDLGLPLIALARVAPAPADGPESEADTDDDRSGRRPANT
jgi:hypothetical protein